MKKSFPIKKIVTFFHSIEKNIWGEDINANPCFATISILFATLIAAITTGGNIINSWFDTDLQCSWYITMTILLFIMVLNVLESILAAENAKVATLRSLLVIGCMLGGALVGAITSVVIAIILAIAAVVLGLYLLSGALSGAASGGSKKGDVELRSYDIIDVMMGQDKISGTMSSDGLTFDGSNGKTYVRDSCSGDFREKIG